ncbi:MAG: hypothetical protein WC423_00875 [Vulcanimicrobiota bacterium]
MVYALSFIGLLLAHGADPTPLDWDEALANLVKFAVTFLLIGFMSYPILEPLLRGDGEAKEEAGRIRSETFGWVLVAGALVLGLGWWLTRTSMVEVMTEETANLEDHAHTQEVGGQVAMWADFHTEVVRVESGEVRIYLRDSYNREIAARFFQAEVSPVVESGRDDFQSTESSLKDTYRFARLGVEHKIYRIKISTPGWTTTLRFEFDESTRRRSLPIWCAN